MLPVVASILASYLAVVHYLKARRRDQLRALKCPRQLSNTLSQGDFPWLWRKALELALFRTYAIPSISKLLEKTGEFEQRAGKRYDDTDLILSEFLNNPRESARSQRALHRLNQIHGMYKSITNDDFLYVLTTFVVDPVRTINKFGWRSLTRQEVDAVVATYADMGRGMNISGVFETYEEAERIHDTHEEKHMVYAPSNRAIADATSTLLLQGIPKALHSKVHRVLVTLMDDRLTMAMGYEPASPVLTTIVHSLLLIRAKMYRWLLPTSLFENPRSPACPFRAAPEGSGGCGVFKYKYTIYQDTYPDGYVIEELGPAYTPKFPGLGNGAGSQEQGQ